MKQIVCKIRGESFFITGGAGFIGTALAEILSRENRVVLFDNLLNNAYCNTRLNSNPNITLIRGDVLDNDALADAMDKNINYVIHCAAIAGVDTVINNPMLTLQVNIQGIFNVFQAASRLPCLKRIVNFSTSEIYGQNANQVGEFDLAPSIEIGEMRWTYAISKLSGEMISHAYNAQNAMPTVTIRPFNIYGPNQVGIGAIHNFVVRAVQGKPLVIHNDGSQIRSWCYIDDFVQGVLLTMENDIAIGKRYNIGNPQSTVSVDELARIIHSITCSESEFEYKKIDYQDISLRIPRITLAQEDLQFEPVVDLRQGLLKTIDWYRDYRKNITNEITAC